MTEKTNESIQTEAQHLSFNRTKLSKALKDYFVKSMGLNSPGTDKTIAMEKTEIIVDRIKALIPILGPASLSDSNLLNIGLILAKDDKPTIIFPCCPDFSHKNGKYNFESISGGVSLVAQKHIEFCHQIIQILPIKPIFLIADTEVNDLQMLNKVKLNRDEFLELVRQSCNLLEESLQPIQGNSFLMSVAIPDMIAREAEKAAFINNSPGLSDRIRSETIARRHMYMQIDSQFSTEEMIARTIRTASQYLALGQLCKENNYLVGNHTTTNLGYYKKAGTALLHNNIEIY